MGLANATSGYGSGGGYYPTATSSYTPSKASSGSLDYLLDPQYTIAQYNAQEEAEYQAVAANYTRIGKTLTREQYRAIKAQALQEMNSSGSSGTSSTSRASSSRSSSSSRSGSSSREHCIMTSVHDYMHCNGSGRCQRCNGKGHYTDSMFGQNVVHNPCNYCNGTGKCRGCGGTGYK